MVDCRTPKVREDELSERTVQKDWRAVTGAKRQEILMPTYVVERIEAGRAGHRVRRVASCDPGSHPCRRLIGARRAVAITESV
jgi:hypothetical protein